MKNIDNYKELKEKIKDKSTKLVFDGGFWFDMDAQGYKNKSNWVLDTTALENFILKEVIPMAESKGREEGEKKTRRILKKHIHLFSEREMLLMNNSNRIMAEQHNNKLKYILENL